MPFPPSGGLDAAFLLSHPDDAAAMLAGLLDSAMDGIITVDQTQRIVLYNRAAEKLLAGPLKRCWANRWTA